MMATMLVLLAPSSQRHSENSTPASVTFLWITTLDFLIDIEPGQVLPHFRVRFLRPGQGKSQKQQRCGTDGNDALERPPIRVELSGRPNDRLRLVIELSRVGFEPTTA